AALDCCALRGLRRSPLLPYSTLFRSQAQAPALPIRPYGLPARSGRPRPAYADSRCAPVSAPARLTAWKGRSGLLLRPLQPTGLRSEEHTSELQSRENLVCRLRLDKIT